MERAPRSSGVTLSDAERHQSEVIAALLASGHLKLAARLARCQDERRHRQPGWPWQCRSAGCWACRRAIMRRWWRGIRQWLGGPHASLAAIPLNGDPAIAAVLKLRRGLRDLRDRAARRHWPWRSVAMAGLVTEGRVLLLVKHGGISRAVVWSACERRWPDVVLGDVGEAVPSPTMSVENAAALARRHRGVEPVRVVIPAQRIAAALLEHRDEPMPTAF